MSLASVIRNGVATANKATSSLQVPVTRRAWVGEAKKGEGDYTSPYDEPDTFQAIVEQGHRLVPGDSGQMIVVIATILILTPIVANGATGRTEPIDSRDRFTLPDGTTGPVIKVSGPPSDPSTLAPYAYEIMLGEA